MKAVVLFVALVATVCAQSVPKIAESFRAESSVQIQNGTHTFWGKGIELRNHAKGQGSLQYVFEEGHELENVFVLERYDLSAIYTIERGLDCAKTTLANDTMPLYWGWLARANLTARQVIDDVPVYIWEAEIGYAKVGVAVAQRDTSVPLAYWRYGPQRNVSVHFDYFLSEVEWSARFFEVPNECKNATFVSKVEAPMCLAGATMIARAKAWSDINVPYNQGATHDGYREDCSGYVSMAWELGGPGLVTSTLPSVSKPIAKADLKAGDVLLDTAEHVVIFAGWTNAAKTEYTAYEETKPGEGTVTRATPYPYWYNTAAFVPYRYNNIC